MSEQSDLQYGWNIGNGDTDSLAVQANSTSPPSKRDRARNLAQRTKKKTKNLLNLNHASDSDSEVSSQGDDIFADPAFNPGKILEGKPPQLREQRSIDLTEKVKSIGSAIAHPRRAIRDTATKSAAVKISSVQRPYLSAESDRNLLAAHDNLAEAISSQSSIHAEDSDEGGARERQARSELETVTEYRASSKTAWTIGRHVQRVRVVQAISERPRRQDFVCPDPRGQQKRLQWDVWIARLALYYTGGFTAQYIDEFDEPPFDIEDLARIIERLSVASAPWQAWCLSVREVYKWEDPRRTARWMVLFWLLWYTEHIVGFVYGYVVYTTIRNLYYPDSVDSVRKAMERGFDRAAKARGWGEMVQKHGREDWIEPLLDELGPLIQLQLGDLANFLEILANFYTWVIPRKTAASIFFFFVCFLITVLADMRYCVKIIWFIIGSAFFFTRPIASRYPKYRYLVSAFRWMFWDIPTDAEWSVYKLQEKSLLRQFGLGAKAGGVREEKSGVGSDSESDYHTPDSEPSRRSERANKEQHKFRVRREGSPGNLIMTHEGLRYYQKTLTWVIPFATLVEVSKMDAPRKAKVRALDFGVEAMEFIYLDNEGSERRERITMSEEARHEIFSLVLGWSGLRWRILHMERNNKAGGEGKSHMDRLFK